MSYINSRDNWKSFILCIRLYIAKERLVGRHFKAKTIRGKFLLSVSLYEKVLSTPVCCIGQIIIKVTLTH